MAQRLSEQVVEWLTVGGDAFTPQTSVPLVVSQPGETLTVPTTNGTSLGAYINKAQLWVLGAAAASTNVKSSQLIVSSSDASSGGAAALELWRGTAASFQFINDSGTFYIKNNYSSNAATTYANSNLAIRYGAVTDQYVHIYSTKDSSYAYSVGGAALSVAGGATFDKKVYIDDTTDSNYATVAGSFVTKGGAYIAKKVYIADTTNSSNTSTGSFSTAGGASIAKKLYVGSDFDQTGDNAIIKSNVIRIQNKSANTSQAGTYPYVTSLHIGDGREVTLDEYQDGALAIHSNKGLFLHTTSSPIAVYDATKTYSVGAIVFYNRQYYRCTTAITEAQEWTAANWTSIGTSANYLKTDATYVVPVITNTSYLGSASLRWKALYVGTADSYGSGVKPIYWNAGVPTVSSSTVGSGVIPIYLSSGTLTASTSTVGSGVKPIYLSSGTLTVSSSSVGGTAQPVYLSSGEIKGISATVGTATKPVYLSGGTITVGTYELKATVNSGTANHIAYYSGANAISSAPNITHGDYSLTITDSGGQSPTFRLTGTSTDFGLLIGSGNTNRGIYSYSGAKWLLHWDNSDTGRLNSTLIPNANNTFSLGSSSAVWSNLYVNNIYLFRQANAAYGRISFYKSDYKTWIVYMSNPASGACPSGGTPSTLGNVTSWALRSYIENSSNYGWIWESAANSNTGTPTARMALSSNDGTLEVAGLIKSTLNGNTVTIGSQNNGWCHIYNSANIPFIFNQTVATSSGGLGTTAYPWNDFYINPTNGSSDFTDGTELLTSYASDNGFADSSGKYKVYKRTASKLLNYLNTKGTYLRYFSASNTSAAASGANDQQAMRQITAIQGLFHNNSRPEGITLTTGNVAAAFGYIISGTSYNTTGTAYGGYFIAHYNTPKYLGISGGSWQMHTLVKGHSSGYYGSSNPPSSAFTGDVYFKII